MIRGARKSFSMTVIFEHYCWTIFGFLNNQHVEANHFLTEQSPACIRPDMLSPPLENYSQKKIPSPKPTIFRDPAFLSEDERLETEKNTPLGSKSRFRTWKVSFFWGILPMSFRDCLLSWQFSAKVTFLGC